MDAGPLVGHLAAWNYFQSVDTSQNKKFVADFNAYCKKNNLPDGDMRVTDDPMEAAYFGVHVWTQAVERPARLMSMRFTRPCTARNSLHRRRDQDG